MLKFAAGLIVGFFLASALVFGFVQANLSPFYNDFKAAQPYAEDAYNFTHSEKYLEIQGFVTKINTAGNALAALPFIGEGIDSTHINEYSQEIMDLMGSTKRITERLSTLISTAIAAIEMASWAYGFSIFMVLAGLGLLAYSCYKPKPAAAPAAPRGKARGRRS